MRAPHMQSAVTTMFAGIMLTLLPAIPVHAQVATAECSAASALATIGIEELSCDCTYHRGEGAASWQFRAEPIVGRVTPGGPAEGKLRSGDVLVAIDGLLITTRSGGVRIANLDAGDPVTITVRRNGREIPVEILPGEPCDLAELAETPVPSEPPVVATVRTPRVPTPRTAPPGRTPVPNVVQPVPSAPPVPTAWFGFGITCTNCSVRSPERLDPSQVELRELLSRQPANSREASELRASIDELRRDSRSWHFAEYPSIYSVDPESPADMAGLRRGDVLMEIDGVSLLTDEGGRRFSTVAPGESVQWTYRRGGAVRKVRVTAVERPEAGAAASLRARYEDLVASVERLHAQDSAYYAPALARLRESVREDQRAEEMALAELAESTQEQHLRFAGMVGNTNVEVRGLGSVDVTFDKSTGELLIHTMDATIRMKAPAGR